MKIEATIKVTERRVGVRERTVEVELTSEAGQAYGQQPVLGAIDHVLEGARKLVQETTKGVD